MPISQAKFCESINNSTEQLFYVHPNGTLEPTNEFSNDVVGHFVIGRYHAPMAYINAVRKTKFVTVTAVNLLSGTTYNRKIRKDELEVM